MRSREPNPKRKGVARVQNTATILKRGAKTHWEKKDIGGGKKPSGKKTRPGRSILYLKKQKKMIKSWVVLAKVLRLMGQNGGKDKVILGNTGKA